MVAFNCGASASGVARRARMALTARTGYKQVRHQDVAGAPTDSPAPAKQRHSTAARDAGAILNLPPMVGMRHGHRVVSLWGICATVLVLEILSLCRFLGARFGLES
jgi:hypothetical protein